MTFVYTVRMLIIEGYMRRCINVFTLYYSCQVLTFYRFLDVFYYNCNSKYYFDDTVHRLQRQLRQLGGQCKVVKL